VSEYPVKKVSTEVLRVAYIEAGSADGWPVLMSHGFPYDVHAFDEVTPILVAAGARVIAPYARGFGPTRFLSADAMRNGQQAARGLDIIQLADALNLDRPILAGYDWGGNASCVAAALWPARVAGLVSYAGYDVIDIGAQRQPAMPSQERVCWYQHLFQTERGRECLALHRLELCRLLWEEWSPGWTFDEGIFERSAASFANPDFVDIVVHAYRFMFGLEGGQAEMQPHEDRLALKPAISVPTISIDGADDPLKPGGTASHERMFASKYEHRTVSSGHNMPQERPAEFADAVITVHDW
jgi:pimeloyl-ACP methyl ester carboxylesterase